VDRRAFIGTLAGGLLASPLAAEAQPAGKVYRVGLVSIGSDPARAAQWQPFYDAMRELNYVEGRNLIVVHAFGAGRSEHLPALVAEMVRANADVIVTTGTRETRAARQATSTIPIVMLLVPDPVAQGFVTSLARPGGNVTGLSNLVPGLTQKYVELLKEVLPSASRFAVIANPPNPVPEHRRELEAAAKVFGMSLSFLPVQEPADFEPILTRAKTEGAAGIIVTSDPVTFLHRRALVQAALKHRMPGIYWAREYVEDGGLMTYSASLVGLRRHAAVYVDKILKGAKPADLPVEQPTKFELVINLKTARALRLTLPPALLARADQIIE
jgi:putative ABC transport system substrate-binding protein